MKSYLSLVPISAHVHRRQSRMTRLCIILAVFLVTAIFSVADMMIRAESQFMLDKHGNWHISLEHISQDMAEEIGRREDVTAIAASSAFNENGEHPFYVNGVSQEMG